AVRRPQLVTIAQTSALPNTQTVLTVNGSGFQNGFSATAQGFSIAAVGLTFISSTQVQVSVKMGGTTTGYTATLLITNPDGKSGSGAFQVEAAAAVGGPQITLTSPSSVPYDTQTVL